MAEQNKPTEPCVPLKEYIEARFKALEAEQRVADKDLERRLSELNELRKQVVEDRARMVPREIYDQAEKERAAWRDTTNTRLTTIETRSVTWTASLGVFFLVLQIILYFVFHR